MKLLFKSLKWLLLSLLLLLSVVVAVLFYFTATETGYRQLPRVISALTPYQISYQQLDGHFWSRQQWQGLTVQGPGIDLHTDTLILENTSSFSPKQIAFSEVRLANATVALQSSTEPQNTTTIPSELPQLNLPFAIKLDNVVLNNVNVMQDGKPSIHIADAELTLSYIDASMVAEMRLVSDVADATLNAELTTQHDYPLKLDVNATLHHLKPAQQLAIHGSGSVLTPKLELDANGYAQVSAVVQGKVALAEQQLDMHLDWQQLQVAGVHSTRGQLSAKGMFQDVLLNLNTDIDGSDLPPMALNVQANIQPDTIKGIALTLKALDGELTFNGDVRTSPTLAWQGELHAHGIDGQAYHHDLPIKLDADILTEGSMTLQQQQALLTIRQLDGKWQGAPLEGKGSLRYNNGHIDAENFHLDLAGNTINANGVLGEEDKQLNVLIHAEHLNHFMPNLHGNIHGQAVLSGAWNNPKMDATLNWQGVLYRDGKKGDVLFVGKAGKLQAQGHFDALNIHVNSDINGRDIADSHIQATAQISPQKIDEIYLQLDSGGSKAEIRGHVALAPEISWGVTMTTDDFNPSRFIPNLLGRINANISSEGHINNTGAVNASAVIHTLAGTLHGKPVQGQGSVTYQNDAIHAEQLLINLAGNRIAANGQLGSSDGTLTLDIDADGLDELLPNMAGKINGQAVLSGALTDPQMDADFHWRNVRYRDGKAVLFDSTQGILRAKGNMHDGLVMNTDITAKGRDFPESQLAGSAHISTTRISDIDLILRSGKGSASVSGYAELQPQIKWDIALKSKQFDPGRFVNGYRGQVNADLTSQGSINAAGKLNATADIKSLSGTLNGQPLSGKGRISVEDEAVDMHHLKLGLGDNNVDINGGYKKNQLNIEFDLNGRRLATFYPALNGTLRAKGRIHGAVAQPNIDLTATADGLRFQDYRIEHADIRIDSGLHQGGTFNNTIALRGVALAGQQWQNIRLLSEGQFNRHKLDVATQGKGYNLNLSAHGGLHSLTHWRGDINKLVASGEGMQWRLKKPSTLDASPEAVALRDFCLVDGISDLCLDLQHAKETHVTYRIGKLSPKSFTAFMPNSIRTAITAKGDGDVRVAANGALSGAANISLTPGNLVIVPEGAPPLTLNLKTGQIKAAFQGQQANILSNIDFTNVGNIQLRAKIQNFSAPRLDGQLSMNIPNIGEFRYLIPMVSDLKGKISGNLRFVGDARQPQVGGEITLANGYVVIPQYATELKDIRLQLAASKSGQIDINGKVGTPKGALNIKGLLSLSPLRLKLNLDGKNMLLANAEDMRVVVSPRFDVLIDPNKGVNVDGVVNIPEARVSIPDTSSGVSISKDVVIVGKDNKTTQEKLKQTSTPFHAKIKVALGDKVYFDNSSVNIRLIGGLTIFLRPSRPITAEGTISVASGVYELYGQELNIQRGRVTFSGGNIANPTVEVLALREINNVKVGAQINGTVEQLNLTLTSTPAMPDSAILSYLLFGRAPDSGTDMDTLLQTAANATLGSVFPNDLSKKAGLDVLDIGITGLKAGKYLGDDLYVGMQSNFFTSVTEFIARYQFSNRLKAEASATENNKAIDFIYEFESN